MPAPRSRKPVKPKPARRAKPVAKKARRAAPAKRTEEEEPVEASAVEAGSPEDTKATRTSGGGLAFPLEIDPAAIETSLKKITDEVSHWAKKGRYTKVRFKFRGKQLLPDIPLAAVVAAEGLTFYWGGVLRALLFTVGANAVFGVELVNDSEKKILAGKEKLLRGDLDEALQLFRQAADMDRDNPHVHLNIGIALKLRGDRLGAREALERAKQLDPHGAIGEEAEKVLSTLPSQMVVTSVVSAGATVNPDRPSGAV